MAAENETNYLTKAEAVRQIKEALGEERIAAGTPTSQAARDESGSPGGEPAVRDQIWKRKEIR
jgi:hypothetical protein